MNATRSAAPNPKRVAAGRLNRAKRKGLTPEGRERLRQLALKHQPWQFSTGPRSAAGKAKVAKVDVDTNLRTATRFNVRSIPMVLFFKDGQVVDQVIGAVPRPVLEEKFRKHAA